jgi:pyruvate ferredoxin oxidoreductase delta subunit
MKKIDVERINSYKPEEHPIGAHIPDAGNSELYETGGWRTFKPVINFEKCIQCLYCFIFCPDSSIKVEDAKVVGVDYDHCKGCGICAAECPKDAIDMIEDIGEE